MENFKMIAEHFNQDLREFWNRANFYLVTNAGLFSAFLIVYPTLIKDHFPVVTLVPLLGIAIATLWFLVLRGSVYWIERWREEIIKLSKELDRFHCYYNVESSLKDRQLLSPSILTKVLPIVFVFAWIAILALILLEILYPAGVLKGGWQISILL
jgi:hypothetical protein